MHTCCVTRVEEFVALNRCFVPWTVEESEDSDVRGYLAEYRDPLVWSDLLQRRRVVLLAEPGSGKSTEIEAQAKACEASGHYTFAATLQSVGRLGMERALGRSATRSLTAWRDSDKQAWFFFDAVDEAKASDVPFDDVLREIADTVDGCRSRAHVLLTGRDANWEVRRDLQLLVEHLSLPPPDAPKPEIDPNDLVVAAISRTSKADEGGATETLEQPIVVRMTPLDEARIATFARSRNVSNTDDFLVAIDKSNLWAFASRPIDLNWLVDYWVANQRFGTLSQMLALSIQQRLQETDPDRVRRDPLSTDRCMEALERIGAALVLQRVRDIEIPDRVAGQSGKDIRSAKLDEILLDWNGMDRSRLISRAMFVPSTAGFVRLHNDNDGVVRGYLTARWLKRLLQTNCPRAEVHDLLFATTYGLNVVIPSLRSTAAWLSVWDSGIAREVIDRDARLLMDAGDPGSLPLEVRERVLRAVVAQVANEASVRVPNNDTLKRFAQADIEPCVRSLWAEFSESAAVRELLLSVILHGELLNCADIAVGASFGAYTDRYTPMFAGVALMATAGDHDKRRYAKYVRDNAETIPRTVLWDAVRGLFPKQLSVKELLNILESIDATDGNSGLDFGYYGPILANRLNDRQQVEELLAGLLSQVDTGGQPLDEYDREENDEYRFAIDAAACRLLELVDEKAVPDIVVDAALWIGRMFSFHTIGHRPSKRELSTLLTVSPERRRCTLWRTVQKTRERDDAESQNTGGIWRFQMLGFTRDFGVDDFDWLLEDAEHRADVYERQVAADAAMTIWRQNDEDPKQLARVQALAERDAAVAAIVSEWTTPRSPSSEESKFQARLAAREKVNAIQRQSRDDSWRTFADEIRANPDRLTSVQPPKNGKVDSAFYHLWKLLNGLGENRGQFAIDDLTPLIPMFGDAAVEAFRGALVRYWRHWTPAVRSERPPDKRGLVYDFDSIGIVGITQEAQINPCWAMDLADEEAQLATMYALNELNGFPHWINDLAEGQPGAVRSVIWRALALERESIGTGEQFPVLSDIARSGKALGVAVAQDIHLLLADNERIAPRALSDMFRILIPATADREALVAIARDRFEKLSEWGESATYLSALYELDPSLAIHSLVSKLSDISASDQTDLMLAVLSSLFGRWEGVAIDREAIPFDSLLTLIRVAYRTVRPADDNVRPTGKSYSPDIRDDAESARSGLLKALFEWPGRATYEAILQLSREPDFAVRSEILVERAQERALIDSEHGIWSANDVYAFEKERLTAPNTPRDLQQLACRRIEELHYDLNHGDFSVAFGALPGEPAVQNWIADRLRRQQGRNYSVEREPHVANEKEPDLRFEAKASSARVPTEIKVVESWSLRQLEDALRKQLIGQYLRDRLNRHGILLLVHQKARRRGWKSPDGPFWNFDQVTDHLRSLARSIAASSPDAAQVEVVVIDVSESSGPEAAISDAS